MAFGPGFCEASSSTLYSNCATFNIGCYLYELSASQYIPVKAGNYSDGVKCADVLTNGYINTWIDCPDIYAITKYRNCSTGDVSDSGSNIPVAYGYFPSDPNFVPYSQWWYKDYGDCVVVSGQTPYPCYVNYIYSSTPVTSVNNVKPLYPLSTTLYDQGGTNGANACNNTLATPTPTPTTTSTPTNTPPNTPSNTLTPTPTPTTVFTISYSFTTTATSAYMTISKNGNTVVALTADGSGNLTVYGSDTISIYSYTTSNGSNTAYNGLTVVDNGSTIYNNTATDPTTAVNSYGTYNPTGDGSITVNAYEF